MIAVPWIGQRQYCNHSDEDSKSSFGKRREKESRRNSSESPIGMNVGYSDIIHCSINPKGGKMNVINVAGKVWNFEQLEFESHENI
jgi:hypothetical protein